MKVYSNRILLGLAALLLVLTGCGKDDSVNTTVTPVQHLFAPEDNALVQLSSSKSASVTFEWEQAHAEDGGLVLYEIAFDTAGGDFSNPVYKISSDGNGLQNTATVLHSTLNKIAGLAGIGSGDTGGLQWTVYSSRGVDAVIASQSRTLEIGRLNGIDNPPAQVFLTGSATENGDDLSQAMELKNVGDNNFEIYTRLDAGTYQLVDRLTGTPATYYIDGDKVKDVAGSTTVAAGDAGIYRITVNFETAAASVTRVKEIGLWFCADNDIRFVMDYTGHGVWEINNQQINFADVSWGKDERYKFRMTLDDGAGGDAYEWYGSSNSDNQRPDASTAGSYFYLNTIENSDQWNYAYKFATEVDGQQCDIKVYFSADVDRYTHEVTIL